MSARKNRSIIVWILIAVVVLAAFSGLRMQGMWIALPGPGYRAYEWHWNLEIHGVVADINNELPDWKTPLYNAILDKWDEQKDDNGAPVVVYGLDIVGYDFVEIPIQEWNFKVNVTGKFYGYFPNNIPEAIPLPSWMDVPDVFDLLIPKVYAVWWVPIAIIAVAVAAIWIAAIVAQYYITHENFLLEKQRAEQSEDWPEWMQFVYFIIQSILGWFQTLGPFGIVAVLAVAAIFIFGGSGIGKKKRR